MRDLTADVHNETFHHHPVNVIALLFVFNAPVVTFNAPTFVIASCSVQPHHNPLNCNVCHIAIPAVVIVFPVVVDVKFIVFEYVRINPLYNVMLPYTFNCGELHAHVTFPLAGAANVRSLHNFVAPASIVTVYAVAFDKESKKTSSDAVGRFPAHGDPPDVVAQWFVASDQFHVPPTQYLLAIV